MTLKNNKILQTLLFLSLIFSFLQNSLADYVRHVIDGDTFVLENKQRVRMIGVDAPEIDHPKYGKKGEPYGNESKKYLKELIDRKDVLLKNGNEEFDKYGRRLAYVYLPDGVFVNLKMIEEGKAEAYRKYPHPFQDEFIQAENTAREGEKGVWKFRKTWWDDLKKNWNKKDKK